MSRKTPRDGDTIYLYAVSFREATRRYRIEKIETEAHYSGPTQELGYFFKEPYRRHYRDSHDILIVKHRHLFHVYGEDTWDDDGIVAFCPADNESLKTLKECFKERAERELECLRHWSKLWFEVQQKADFIEVSKNANIGASN